MTRRRNPHLATMYFADPEEAGFFAIRMNGDVTYVRGNFPWAVTFNWKEML